MFAQTIEELKKATPLKIISIISDFATILGVSVGTLVAGPLLGELTGKGFDLSDFLWAVFFYFLFISLFALALTRLIKQSIHSIKNKLYPSGILSLAGTLLFVALAINLFPNMTNLFGNVSGSRYLLPPKPSLVNAKLNTVKFENEGEMLFLKGNISFDETADPNDYTVALYLMNKETGEYEYSYFGQDKTYALLNSDGDFTMPKVPPRSKENAYIAVYLLADKKGGIGREFPNKLTQIPAKSMDQLGAKAFRVP
ncbi:hypothetical protein OMR72_003397 [Vibrio parahaemolyticus]|uniref:hypothetical protein n=1 Tax=Vibrio parahaemolyticus TaxID=670 RepID=UPI00111E7ED9|nr:hypothetical protein [Vibrio parahaemolyticus]EGQ8540908.1 hypothetical protein [Vibrio parahaemolyticus]EJG1014267.1 hypothetical protein [Vibrio parahaemolyticus]EKA8935137.1 hypothetical protein [Vibrio parahaemolyticus]EKF6610619.1 hypothetical protein [Vibrio parahaemolyticus]MBE4164549.1 hypothetical protein [Vibrio parahaemolyticus]